MRTLKNKLKAKEGHTDLVVLQQDLTMASLAYPKVVIELFPKILDYFSKRTVSVRNLQISLSKESAMPSSIGMNIANAIKLMPEEEAADIWNRCDRFLKSEALMQCGEHVDIELYKKLGLEPSAIVRAFFYHRAFKSPIETPYSRKYGAMEIETAEEFIAMLEELDPVTRAQVLSQTSIQVLYLIAIPEINYLSLSDRDGLSELFAAFKCGDTVPQQAPFLFFLQESAPFVFEKLKIQILDRNWDELRELFYELYWRTRNYSNENEGPSFEIFGEIDSDFIETELED